MVGLQVCVVLSKDCMIDKHECVRRAETGLLYSWMHKYIASIASI